MVHDSVNNAVNYLLTFLSVNSFQNLIFDKIQEFFFEFLIVLIYQRVNDAVNYLLISLRAIKLVKIEH